MWEAYDKNDRRAEISHLKGAEQALRDYYGQYVIKSVYSQGRPVSDGFRWLEIDKQCHELTERIKKGERYVKIEKSVNVKNRYLQKVRELKAERLELNLEKKEILEL